jgi:cation diffusion facilitator family transporter
MRGPVGLVQRRRALMGALAVAITVHAGLAVAQLVAAWVTSSVGITASALHVVVGTAAHVVALGGTWLATRPPDARHPYGYERYEAVASLLIGILLLAAVGLIVVTAVPRLLQPRTLAASTVGLAVMSASAAANAALAVFLGRRATDNRSRVLRAEATHAFADFVTALAVTAGVGLSAVGLLVIDPLVAVAVGVVVAWRGLRVAWGAAEMLADAAPLDLESIRALVRTVPGVRDVHAVRSRGEAGRALVDLHIHVSPELTVAEAHVIAGRVTDVIEAEVAEVAEVLVHVGPHLVPVATTTAITPPQQRPR